jgi:hypothetical protein
MNPKKLDRILKFFREEGMVGNAPGTQGGFSASSPAEGPTAGGPDKGIGKGKMRRRAPIIGKGKFPGLRKRWQHQGYVGVGTTSAS